ncbi:MAG: hypothetical protein NZ572_08315 [Thermoflexus sp.]|nr:hypothetical protein [Thermoflexus sp.]
MRAEISKQEKRPQTRFQSHAGSIEGVGTLFRLIRVVQFQSHAGSIEG